MRPTAHALALAAALALLAPLCAFGPQSPRAADADIIVTAAPVYAPLAALKGEERFPSGAQLLRVHAGQAAPLVAGFWATADANVSFDATTVLFAAKKTAADPWQVWELALNNGSLRRLVAAPTDAILPFYLPAGQLLYALKTPHGFQLQVAGKAASSALAPIDPQAGQQVQPVSWVPGNALPSDVLADGRVLFEAAYPLGVGSTPELYLVYTDGSGVESYRCDHGQARWGGRQLASGDVVFTHGGSLARFTSPLAQEAPVPAPHGQYAGAVAETASGEWLISARIPGEPRFALKQWKPGPLAPHTLLAMPGKDLVEPVPIAPRTRPHHHPTALHPWTYANLLALDARLSREGDLKSLPAMVQMEALDAQGKAVVTGTAQVARDGSFFVRTPGDRPIRFALLDAQGVVLRQEHGWFWARRGEQRYCVGCHAGPERAPENRVPQVLLETTKPIDLTGDEYFNLGPAEAPKAAEPGGN